MKNQGSLMAVGQTAVAPQVVTGVKYCLYARKSSEDDERQALSIDSQIKEMLAMAERDGMEIAEIRRESHSAKASGMRAVYNQLVLDIRSGMFSGILTWAPDRLSRNAGDLGSIVDLMDQGLLKEIRTQGQRFTNSPSEKFLLMILCSQAKLENDNKGVNVKRGQRAKLEMGHRPCLAPIGYLNEKLVERGKSRILLDPKRGPLVKRMFELVANKFYTGRELFAWCREYGLDSRTGKALTLSGIYRILSSTFYYGEFEWPEKSGNWYKGNYEPLITKELFQKARGNLLAAHRSKPGSKEFSFTRLLLCGSCGSGITAEEKFKHSKDGRVTRYIYYHCTRFQNQDCPEPFIREEELLGQLMDLVDKLDLDKLGIKKQVEKELERFRNFSSGILGKMLDQEALTKAVDTRSYAKHILEHGTKDEKHLLLQSLKSRLYLKNRKLKVGKVRNGNRTEKH